MRLGTFRAGGEARFGVLAADGAHVVDLAAAWQAMSGRPEPALGEAIAFLDRGPAAFDEARRALAWAEGAGPAAWRHPLASVQLLAPVPRPRSLRDCMVCEGHVLQCIRAIVRRRRPWLVALDRALERLRGRGLLRPPAVWYRQPIYYKGNPFSVVGPEAEILWPRGERHLDYELEFGIVLGRRGKDIPASRAREFIAGYTIFNDFSARDLQLREMAGRLGPAKGKDFDTGNALGPWLVTPEEIPDPYRLAMAARVNGQTWSQGTSGAMRFSFEEILEYISRDQTVWPGEVIGSGAIPGGCGLELDRWLAPGDVVELEVERLGLLRNRIGHPAG
jgi:2-keto-4-pentenoate hydratase/2-oxohepta-3-ene-1,7-dioic acid hydratase in catechol pathway